MSEMINEQHVSFFQPVAKKWLIGWRKHLASSQTTPKWLVGSWMSAILPLQIPQMPKEDHASKHLQNDEQENYFFVL